MLGGDKQFTWPYSTLCVRELPRDCTGLWAFCSRQDLDELDGKLPGGGIVLLDFKKTLCIFGQVFPAEPLGFHSLRLLVDVGADMYLIVKVG